MSFNKISGNITIQDIAAHAGVGAGTVSRVLNNHPNVSEPTRQKILKAIEELKYRPNFSARQMRTGESLVIGFITDEIASTPFAVNVVKGAQMAAWEFDKLLFVVNSDRNAAIEHEAIERMLQRGVDAIIYASMFHRQAALPDAIHEVPAVLVDCFLPDESLPSVVPDEFGAAYEATEILIHKGHTRVGLINLGGEARPAVEGRLAGYTAAMQAHGLYNPDLMMDGGDDGAGLHGYENAYRIMRLPEPPTAIFCAQDRIAAQVYRALYEMNLSIPDDVAIIGFDDHIDVATTLLPSLSTMALPHYQMGKWAVEYLMQGVDQPLTPVQVKLPCSYIERESA
ncbi:MAG: LacI family DNA-binding transcriptional regulator [Anaerolineae bacterium]|nr:LacI family DNA-binding transcriptional regulator [Anaerolineae bacterium]